MKQELFFIWDSGYNSPNKLIRIFLKLLNNAYFVYMCVSVCVEDEK